MRGRQLLEWIEGLEPDARDAGVETYLNIRTCDVSSVSPGEHLIGYHQSGVDAVLQAFAEVPLQAHDVLIDLGSGLGKVVMLAHLLTGAKARGIEIQSRLVEQARGAATRLGLDVDFTQADVRDSPLDDGTVFFLYLPFTGPVLADVLRRLEQVAKLHAIVVCALGVEVERLAPWLVPRPLDAFWLSVYDSC